MRWCVLPAARAVAHAIETADALRALAVVQHELATYKTREFMAQAGDRGCLGNPEGRKR